MKIMLADSREQLAWAAGFLDGEGHFGLNRNQRRQGHAFTGANLIIVNHPDGSFRQQKCRICVTAPASSREALACA